jgi:hypothetical protein
LFSELFFIKPQTKDDSVIMVYPGSNLIVLYVSTGPLKGMDRQTSEICSM